MIIVKTSSALNRALLPHKPNPIGFVPTMGALHNGHITLIEQAAVNSDFVVCSIFVNPTQFNNPADFAKYPITLEKDILMLEKAGADMLFLPLVSELYPAGIENLERYDLGYLETVMEGSFRPGHFQGVCQVMSRLIRAVGPDKLFMGQKDYQQCMVVKRLLEIMKSPVEFITCPTVREADGLAMSSRNMRLNADERNKATAIYRALTYIKTNLSSKAIGPLKSEAHSILTAAGLKPDYIEIADGDDLHLLKDAKDSAKSVALIAAFMNEVRLIDNMIL